LSLCLFKVHNKKESDDDGREIFSFMQTFVQCDFPQHVPPFNVYDENDHRENKEDDRDCLTSSVRKMNYKLRH
jgi:hypothetical protein